MAWALCPVRLSNEIHGDIRKDIILSRGAGSIRCGQATFDFRILRSAGFVSAFAYVGKCRVLVCTFILRLGLLVTTASIVHSVATSSVARKGALRPIQFNFVLVEDHTNWPAHELGESLICDDHFLIVQSGRKSAIAEAFETLRFGPASWRLPTGTEDAFEEVGRIWGHVDGDT